MTTPSGSEGRLRAHTACTFCRRRKMKCNNERPRCVNCTVYEQECVYTQHAKKARPSNSRISQLEEVNQSLRERLANVSATSSPGPSRRQSQIEVGSAAQHNSSLPLDPEGILGSGSKASGSSTDEEPQFAVARRSQSLNDEDVFNGPLPTSILKGRSLDHGLSSSVSLALQGPIEGVQVQLQAEAAQQRRLEAFNFYSGALDFDGMDPELGMHLLSIHWNRQHHGFMITYRPAFMRDMACRGPYFSKLLLNAIYYAASKFSSRVEVRSDPNDSSTAGYAYRQRAKELLEDAMDRSEVPTIQALLVIAASLFALGEKSMAWLYSGIAFRMIFDLGMHVDNPLSSTGQLLTHEEREIRRRVFWAAFVVDKVLSLYQDRPFSLQEMDSRVPLMFLDQYEEMEPWKPFGISNTHQYPGSPTYSISSFTSLCQLCVFMNRIRNQFYSEKTRVPESNQVVAELKSFYQELENWHGNLPPHLKYDPLNVAQVVPPPHVLALLFVYNLLLIRLHLPIIADGHLFSITPLSAAQEAFGVCRKAATEIVQLLIAYRRAFVIQRAPYLIAYATYVAAEIHVQVAVQYANSPGAHECLRICLGVLNENQLTNSMVVSTTQSLVDLMKQAGVALQDDPNVPFHNQVQEPRITSQFGSTERESFDSTYAAPDDFNIDVMLQNFNNSSANAGFLGNETGQGPYPFSTMQSSALKSPPILIDPTALEYESMALDSDQDKFETYSTPTNTSSEYGGSAYGRSFGRYNAS